MLTLVLAVPQLVHVLEPANTRSLQATDKPPDEKALERQLQVIPGLPFKKPFD